LVLIKQLGSPRSQKIRFFVIKKSNKQPAFVPKARTDLAEFPYLLSTQLD